MANACHPFNRTSTRLIYTHIHGPCTTTRCTKWISQHCAWAPGSIAVLVPVHAARGGLPKAQQSGSLWLNLTMQQENASSSSSFAPDAWRKFEKALCLQNGPGHGSDLNCQFFMQARHSNTPCVHLNSRQALIAKQNVTWCGRANRRGPHPRKFLIISLFNACKRSNACTSIPLTASTFKCCLWCAAHYDHSAYHHHDTPYFLLRVQRAFKLMDHTGMPVPSIFSPTPALLHLLPVVAILLSTFKQGPGTRGRQGKGLRAHRCGLHSHQCSTLSVMRLKLLWKQWFLELVGSNGDCGNPKFINFELKKFKFHSYSKIFSFFIKVSLRG